MEKYNVEKSNQKEKKVFYLLQAHSSDYFPVSTGSSKIRRKSWYFEIELRALEVVQLGVTEVIYTKKQNQLSRYE